MFRRLSLIPILLVVLTSCRNWVLEDRTLCPALLCFDIANAASFDRADYIHVMAFHYPEDVLLGKDTATVNSIQEREYYLKVRRSETVYGYGVAGFSRCHLEKDTQWVVDQGADFGPLWRFDFRTSASDEQYLIPVEMVKDHCNIEVFFKEYDMFPGTDGHFPYSVFVKSNTCGINALTGEPVKGTFYYEPKESPGGTFKFTVPRQFDRSLVIEVYNTEEYHGNTDHVATFNVWNWAHAMEDFSWKDKNLADLSIVIEMASGRYEVSVLPWRGTGGGYVYDF